MRLHRSDAYHADLIAIVEPIARDHPAVALALWDTIERQVERLAAHPRSSRPGRVPETRELMVVGAPYIGSRQDLYAGLRHLGTKRQLRLNGSGCTLNSDFVQRSD